MINFIKGIPVPMVIVISIIITIVVTLIKQKNIKQHIEIFKYFLVILYFITVLFVLFNHGGYGYYSNTTYDMFTMGLNVKPFHTISEYIQYNNFIPLIGSILITTPLFPICYMMLHNKISSRILISVLFICVILIEPIQLGINLLTNFPGKVIDIDDTILNIVGYILGIIYVGYKKSTRKQTV